MKVKDHEEAVDNVIHSGLLPEELLKQWIDSLVKRAIHRTLGKSGVPAWEEWATNWLSGADRSAEKAAWPAREADAARAQAAAWSAWSAADAAQAAWAQAAWSAREADAWSDAEIEVQYLELLELINTINTINTGDES
jgi:thioredoxin-like negative regulator of GroEL